ncbi:hypothetical protein DL769_008949 [Monosporascus sp. CRB-8-3]|nr:hypothetical protein DL769_008949 [Monosporascus sp. CRB-8-3]
MDPAIAPVKSAELPVMPRNVVELVKMVDDGKSFDEMFEKLMNSSMAEDVEFGDDEVAMGRLRNLFHTLSRPMLRSVLMKHLGPDLYNADRLKENHENVCSCEHSAGSYVAFIYVPGCWDRFLTAKETRRLVGDLRRYAREVDIFDSCVDERGYSQLVVVQDREDLVFAQEVDDEVRNTVHWDPANPRFERPRFGGVPSTRPGVQKDMSVRIRHLIGMFLKRCRVRSGNPVRDGGDNSMEVSEDGGDDEDDDEDGVYQRQSPLMVGNAGVLRNRVVSHYPDTSMDATEKVWALTLSCLRKRGMEVYVKVVPLCLAMEEDEIDAAEILGTILADSFLPGDGFNVKQPGTRGRSDRTSDLGFRDAEAHIYYKGWLRDNLAGSIKYHRSLREGRAEKDKVIDQYNEKLEERRRARKRLLEAREKLKEAGAGAADTLEHGEELLASLRQRNQVMELFRSPYDEK